MGSFRLLPRNLTPFRQPKTPSEHEAQASPYWFRGTQEVGHPERKREIAVARSKRSHKEVDDEGNRCDGPGCANGRDEVGGAARAAGSDKRRRRSGSCVGIRLG